MKFWRQRFNNYLLLLLVVCLVPACQTAERKKKKQVSALRVHIEARPDIAERTQPVSIFRENPMIINVDRSPILNEEHVKEVVVEDDMGGFSLRIEFNRQGSWLLEQYTGSNHGKRLAVFGTFGVETKDSPQKSRWFAAPRITQRITDGRLQFTPDASREEADEFALGLNNAARKLKDLEAD